MDSEKIIKQTESWIRSFIINYNICPFAHSADENNSIHYAIIQSTDWEEGLHAMVAECQLLDTRTEIETSFIVFPNSFDLFEDYLDFLAMAESLLIELNYEGIYQIASFHPEYCFEGSQTTDPANYTNRSPYPMLHLIREASLEHALQTYHQPENIPQRNIELTREMGLAKVRAILEKCYH
jgi:hypothetical protein